MNLYNIANVLQQIQKGLGTVNVFIILDGQDKNTLYVRTEWPRSEGETLIFQKNYAVQSLIDEPFLFTNSVEQYVALGQECMQFHAQSEKNHHNPTSH